MLATATAIVHRRHRQLATHRRLRHLANRLLVNRLLVNRLPANAYAIVRLIASASAPALAIASATANVVTRIVIVPAIIVLPIAGHVPATVGYLKIVLAIADKPRRKRARRSPKVYDIGLIYTIN